MRKYLPAKVFQCLQLQQWRWPLPALVSWLLCWLLFRQLQPFVPLLAAWGVASGAGVLLSVWGHTWWRRAFIGSGFPLSLWLSGSVLGFDLLPAWAWLLPLAFLFLIYPVNAWRDAPLFPTPAGALQRLPELARLPSDALVLDAGCGAGDGLKALHTAYPHVQLHGMEWSWALRWLCALRCPWARIRQGDIWLADWAPYDMVYLFQRPESMTRAALKSSELRPGSWLVSLDFPATHLRPSAQYQTAAGKTVWLYQAPVISA